MSKEILQQIRITHDRNRAEAGLPTVPYTIEHPESDPNALLDSVERRVSARLQERVEHAVSDFSRRLQLLSTRHADGDDPLLKTQEITFEDIQRSSASSLARGDAVDDKLHTTLRSIEQRLESLTLDSAVDHGSTLDEVKSKLEQIEARLDHPAPSPAGLGDGASTDIVTQMRRELEVFHETLMETLQSGELSSTAADSPTNDAQVYGWIQELGQKLTEQQTRFLDRVGEQLSSQWEDGMTQVVPDATSNPQLQVELEATRRLLEKLLQSQSDTEERNLADLMERVLERLDSPSTEYTDSPLDSRSQLEQQQAILERLNEMEGVLSQIWDTHASTAQTGTTSSDASTPAFDLTEFSRLQSALAESVQALEAQRESNNTSNSGAANASGQVNRALDREAMGEVTEALLQRLSQLETFLHNDWESALQRFSEVASEPSEAETEVLKGLMEIRELIDRTPSTATGNSEAQTSTELSVSANDNLVLEQVQSLRKDFSILVHTLNSHLEESQLITQQVADNVRESIVALERVGPSLGGEAGGDMTSVVGSLQNALGDLDDLRTLPEKISAILSAADEVNQFSLSSAIQDAVDQITAQLREWWEPQGTGATGSGDTPRSAATKEQLSSGQLEQQSSEESPGTDSSTTATDNDETRMSINTDAFNQAFGESDSDS